MEMRVRISDIDYELDKGKLTVPSSFSFKSPILIDVKFDGKPYRCMDGHRRLTILTAMGVEYVQVHLLGYQYKFVKTELINISSGNQDGPIIFGETNRCVSGIKKVETLKELGILEIVGFAPNMTDVSYPPLQKITYHRKYDLYAGTPIY